jgi:membrane protein implicated in regulation of membrane protease activity
MIGLILMGQRERTLGSPWISWLGLVAAVAHGSVMWLVVVFQVNGAGILFPIYALTLSLWFILAGMWPNRQPVEKKASDEQAVGATLVRT